jgi:hypothetical protein
VLSTVTFDLTSDVISVREERRGKEVGRRFDAEDFHPPLFFIISPFGDSFSSTKHIPLLHECKEGTGKKGSSLTSIT